MDRSKAETSGDEAVSRARCITPPFFGVMLRRTGTAPSTGVRNGPGSAVQR